MVPGGFSMQRSLFLLALVAMPRFLSGQASDLIDMKDLAGRGMLFETEDTDRYGIQKCISV